MRGRLFQVVEGGPQIGASLLKVALALFTPLLTRAIDRHHGSDRRAQRKKERQRDQTLQVEWLCAQPQIVVEHGVCRRWQLVPVKVHEKKGTIIKGVDGGD